MPNLAANLSMMFTEVPFLERFAAAADAGFKGVEYLFPYDHPAETIAKALQDNGLQNVLFNLPPGNWETGDRGLAALPGREADFEGLIDKALEYAQVIGCPRLHVMAGIPPEDANPYACQRTYVENVRLAAERAAPHGITVLLEPINPRDIPGYYLNRQDDGLKTLDTVGAENAALQMDLYHCQIVEGDVAMKIRANIDRVAHFQIAGVPDRHEPDLGEVNYPYLFDVIDELGFEGWIGCEYRPKGETRAGLGWAAPYGISG
ncbi:MAG: hydroxypyruvate isomerase family protein [Rhodospirillaceae bacterium]|nr:hydroxypyruvate isomerase family protein [Rhodospirillaceae bacterium]MDD9916698.1 hydroxypyruvate isomerase family protein [Rhodospirillaceae bacterium]MDD9926310.1 hydroxypyruvate isomerase family protein [Rhodospirillaceae bacterium]